MDCVQGLVGPLNVHRVSVPAPPTLFRRSKEFIVTKLIAAAAIALSLVLVPAAVEAKSGSGKSHHGTALSSTSKKATGKSHKHRKHKGLHKGHKKHSNLKSSKPSTGVK